MASTETSWPPDAASEGDRQEMLMDWIFKHPVGGTEQNVGAESALFAGALASIGQIADEVDRIVETTGALIATMSTRGDRIDRVQAQNRVAIEALLSDAGR